MFPFKKTYPSPSEKTAGRNSKRFVVVHHTGTGEGTIKGVLDGLYRRADYASCHFVVDTNGDAYKIGSPDDILWHAGESTWNGLKDLNRYAIGIEVIGPLANGGFTDEQRMAVRALTQHLMATFSIPASNVLRHKDIAPKRKWDIADTFWNGKYKNWGEYQKSLVPKAL